MENDECRDNAGRSDAGSFVADAAAVLIPAYNPDEKLLALLDEITPLFPHVVVVNDGSTTGTKVFDDVRARGLPVLVHVSNRGKGAALKTGFRWILANLPGCVTVVTADADGQHRPADIVKVAAASLAHQRGLALGVRAFSGNVPLRSRFGNWWTRQVFFLMTRLRISDTQTGLRGIPTALLPRLLELEGDRYEYEMQMLAGARRHDEPPVQVPIETVYIAGNASSHFNPLRDSIRIYGALVKFCISSVSCFLLDNAIFTSVMTILTRSTDWRRATEVFVAFVSARAVSSTVNYVCNRRLVFRSSVSRLKSFFKYWLLVLVIMSAGYGLTAGLSRLVDAHGLAITAIKIAVETALFFFSYGAQKRWIFRS